MDYYRTSLKNTDEGTLFSVLFEPKGSSLGTLNPFKMILDHFNLVHIPTICFVKFIFLCLKNVKSCFSLLWQCECSRLVFPVVYWFFWWGGGGGDNKVMWPGYPVFYKTLSGPPKQSD